MTTRATDDTGVPQVRRPETRESTKTKSAGYLINRGLAKAGSRDPYRD